MTSVQRFHAMGWINFSKVGMCPLHILSGVFLVAVNRKGLSIALSRRVFEGHLFTLP